MQPNRMNVTQRVVTLPAGVSTALAPAVTSGRNYLGFTNIGAGDAFLGFDATAVVNSGWPLYASGGGMTFTNAEGVPTNAVTAISTAGSTVVVLEG